jgi:hypothetical protein
MLGERVDSVREVDPGKRLLPRWILVGDKG